MRATLAPGPAADEEGARPVRGAADRTAPARHSEVGSRAVRLSPLMSERPPGVQVVLVVVVPAVYGAIVGLVLGWSEAVYVVLSLLAILGGIGAGFDHLGAAAGARRGLVGGALFGSFVLIAHELSGQDAEADLPDPAIVLVVVITLFGVALGALGGWLRARVERRAQPATRA